MYSLVRLMIIAAVGVFVVLCDNLQHLNVKRDAKLSPVNIFAF